MCPPLFIFKPLIIKIYKTEFKLPNCYIWHVVPFRILQETADLLPFLSHDLSILPFSAQSVTQNAEKTGRKLGNQVNLLLNCELQWCSTYWFLQVIRKGYMAIHNLGIMKGQFLKQFESDKQDIEIQNVNEWTTWFTWFQIPFNLIWLLLSILLFLKWVFTLRFGLIDSTLNSCEGGSRDYWFVLTSESLSWFKDEEVRSSEKHNHELTLDIFRRKTRSSCYPWTSWSSETSSPPSCLDASCSPSTVPREGTCSRTSRWVTAFPLTLAN